MMMYLNRYLRRGEEERRKGARQASFVGAREDERTNDSEGARPARRAEIARGVDAGSRGELARDARVAHLDRRGRPRSRPRRDLARVTSCARALRSPHAARSRRLDERPSGELTSSEVFLKSSARSSPRPRHSSTRLARRRMSSSASTPREDDTADEAAATAPARDTPAEAPPSRDAPRAEEDEKPPIARAEKNKMGSHANWRPDEVLYRGWFPLADDDADGRVTGADAVRFFGRSGLPKEILARVWQLADANRQGFSRTRAVRQGAARHRHGAVSQRRRGRQVHHRGRPRGVHGARRRRRRRQQGESRSRSRSSRAWTRPGTRTAWSRSSTRCRRTKARSISHWSPYDRVGVVNADP